MPSFANHGKIAKGIQGRVEVPTNDAWQVRQGGMRLSNAPIGQSVDGVLSLLHVQDVIGCADEVAFSPVLADLNL